MLNHILKATSINTDLRDISFMSLSLIGRNNSE